MNTMLHKTKFIGVVDDELDIMCLFKDALSQMGEERVFGFTDSPLALDHFKLNSENYSLILSDYRMPILDGIQLLKGSKIH
jgi:CheY-like chemotaxis protein